VYGEQDNAYRALKDISLEIAEGELLCLLGPSGCGKTTLLNILAGFEPVTAGRVTLGGREISGPGRDRMVFFQDAGSALFPWLTVEENVNFGLRIQNVDTRERQPVIDRYLEMVGLGEHRAKFPSQLSGGMRQRLQIARALAVEPDILLMDEPFAALDALTRQRMHRFLLDIWEATRKTIVFVTHDISESILLANRIAMMTVGPDSSFKEIVHVDLPRPRDPADSRFGELYHHIESLLSSEVEKVEADA
jgi:NitT/TauT family transport system ATP-binding protein